MSHFDNIKPLIPTWPARPWVRRTPPVDQDKNKPSRDRRSPGGKEPGSNDKPGHIDEYA